MLFLEFTAGEILVRSCRSALQARIAAESRSYCKIFCNDRVNNPQSNVIFTVISDSRKLLKYTLGDNQGIHLHRPLPANSG